MNRKHVLPALLAGLSVMLLTAGCSLDHKTYTVQAGTDVEDTRVYIQYRESGTEEWTDARLVDENGLAVEFLEYDDLFFTDTGYFDLPGQGQYDFRGVDEEGEEVGEDELLDHHVEHDNLGMKYGYTLFVSDEEDDHDFY